MVVNAIIEDESDGIALLNPIFICQEIDVDIGDTFTLNSIEENTLSLNFDRSLAT